MKREGAAVERLRAQRAGGELVGSFGEFTGRLGEFAQAHQAFGAIKENLVEVVGFGFDQLIENEESRVVFLFEQVALGEPIAGSIGARWIGGDDRAERGSG